MLRLAGERSFGIMKLWIRVLFLRSHFVWGLVMVVVLGLYFCAIGGCCVSTPTGSPLDTHEMARNMNG